jgi:hut operon positive regulator
VSNSMQKTSSELNLGKIAISLALSSDSEEEQKLKDKYNRDNYICAITATGGEIPLLAKKINNAVIGACLNNNVIEKTPEEIHAVIHATLEAKQGLLLTVPSGASFVGKVAIVRKDRWIAVAIYGHSAMHFMTNHERIGLGIMHI